MGDDNINVGMVIGDEVGTGRGKEVAVAEPPAEVEVEGRRGGGDPLIREVGEPDTIESEGEEEPAGPFPGAEGGGGGARTEGADETKPEKRGPAAGVHGAELAAAAGPSGVNNVRAGDEEPGAAGSKGALGAWPGAESERVGLGGSDGMKREAVVAADPHGGAGKVARAASPKSKSANAPGGAAPPTTSENEDAPGAAAGPHDNGVGVRAGALLAFGAALVAFGAAAAQRHFAVGETLGAPTPADVTLEGSMSPFFSAHQGRSVTGYAFPAHLTRHPLPADSDAMHQEPPHLGMGRWVHMPRAGTSAAIPAEGHQQNGNGLYTLLGCLFVIFLAAAVAALVLLLQWLSPSPLPSQW